MAFKTPSIPPSVGKIYHPLYRNIFSYSLGNRHLWGTETLLGDWDGEHLLIAKDFYPAQYIDERLEAGDPNPYSHNPKAPTNKNLIKTLRHFGQLRDGFQNTSCNFLYVSACFLLRNDGLKRGELPDAQQVLSISAPVVRLTMDHMPKLRKVVAMGGDAARALGASGLYSEIKSRKLSYFEVSHPARALSNVDRFAEWSAVFGKH
ncbi:hypothetical protein ACFSQQ_15940 [Mesorhizobium kowhaii]|uniref:hypothetical protein n=1 Tax=Mesorhizobium kowhaii TaxID=1300272 RepID=UPI0035EFB959